jgi:hypothetical protein
LVHRRDKRALPLLWELAARDGLTAEQAAAVYDGLTVVLFNTAVHHYIAAPPGGTPPDVAAVTAAARPRAEAGPELQRLLALMLLAKAAPEVAGELAAKFVAAPETPPGLRRDAFQISLQTKPRSEMLPAALEALAHADAGVRRVGVAILAGRASRWLREFRDGHLSLEGGEVVSEVISENRPFVPEPPDGLTADAVRPFLADTDPATVAAAGYLLTLFGDASGFDPLVRYWHEHGQHDEFWTRLVSRAVTALDDDGRVAVLEEVYRGLGDRGAINVREFYWTIRALSGPNALRLRKLIRDEVGMNSLRGGGGP